MAKKRTSSKSVPPERIILNMRSAGFPEIKTIGKYHYNSAHQQLAAHSHRRMMEIVFCSKGQQVYEVHDELYRLQGGDLFVTFPGEWHGSGEFPEDKGELYWIILDLEPARRHQRFLQFEKKQCSEWLHQLQHLPRHFKGNAQIRKTLEEIFELFPQRKSPLAAIRLRHAIADCLLEIIACSGRDADSRTGYRLQSILHFLETHLDDPVSLDELAQLAELSLSHFKYWFRKETGTTPLDFALRFKIKKAQELLQNTNHTITRIAFDTGFQNSQYFATVFRKYTGITPSHFRQRAS